MIRICFVCLGNICRSPTAEAIMRSLVSKHGLSKNFLIESAGTGDWHVGQPADPRSVREAHRRGVPITGVARCFEPEDFSRFDYVIAMDHSNFSNLENIARSSMDIKKINLLRNFDEGSEKNASVPDPYQGGADGFAHVFDICLAGCTGLLAHIRKTHAI